MYATIGLNSFLVESELYCYTAVVPLAIQQATVNAMFVVATWARQHIQITVVPMGEPAVNNNTMFVVAIRRDNIVK